MGVPYGASTRSKDAGRLCAAHAVRAVCAVRAVQVNSRQIGMTMQEEACARLLVQAHGAGKAMKCGHEVYVVMKCMHMKCGHEAYVHVAVSMYGGEQWRRLRRGCRRQACVKTPATMTGARWGWRRMHGTHGWSSTAAAERVADLAAPARVADVCMHVWGRMHAWGRMRGAPSRPGQALPCIVNVISVNMITRAHVLPCGPLRRPRSAAATVLMLADDGGVAYSVEAPALLDSNGRWETVGLLD
eukprot:jgi/Ulvmu1/6639/UM003_0277.1